MSSHARTKILYHSNFAVVMTWIVFGVLFSSIDAYYGLSIIGLVPWVSAPAMHGSPSPKRQS